MPSRSCSSRVHSWTGYWEGVDMNNHVKEMLKKVQEIDKDSSWYDIYGGEIKIRNNIYKYGTHVEMFALDKDGMVTSKDVTKEFLNMNEIPHVTD